MEWQKSWKARKRMKDTGASIGDIPLTYNYIFNVRYIIYVCYQWLYEQLDRYECSHSNDWYMHVYTCMQQYLDNGNLIENYIKHEVK